MRTLANPIYGCGIVCAFAFALAAPQLISREYRGFYEEIGLFFANSPIAIAIAVLLAAIASGATTYIMVRVLAQEALIFLLLMKLFVLAILAIAAGFVLSMILGLLGVYEAAFDCLYVLAIGATMYLCGGVCGLVAMRSAPRYRQV
jgi:hypothetical protein